MAASVVVSAPGKLMISGEYAVLEGAGAVVAAVSRRVRVWLASDEAMGTASDLAPPSDDAAPRKDVAHRAPPEAVAARRIAEQRWGRRAGRLWVDVRDTRVGDQKLGVGSSAAAAAATAGLIAALAGDDLKHPAVRRAVLDAAFAGHAEVAPRGSGADVAAATMGGFIAFRRRAQGFECEPLRWPDGLQARVVWTGKQVRTSEMLERVHALRQANPSRYIRVMDQLRSAAETCAAAFRSADVSRVIGAVSAYREAMAALGAASGAPIIDETLETIARAASRTGGAAKPSGAGGGDVAIALFPEGTSAANFEDTCQESGLNVVQMELGVTGVRVEE